MPIRIANGINLGKLKAEAQEVTPDALKAGADHVLEVSQELVPVLVDVERANRRERPETLKESGFTEVRDENTAVVGYKDFISARQHEDLEYHHDIGRAKYLEDPLKSETDEVMRIVSDKLREALNG